MNMKRNPKVLFEVLPMKAGAGWNVRITAESGPVQYMSGFDSERDASDWIEHKSKGWLAMLDGARARV
jgi:hypothetical protein